MPIDRIKFEFLAPAGSGALGGGSGISTVTDTGPAINGEIYAVRFESLGSADTGATDTGADLQLFLQQRSRGGPNSNNAAPGTVNAADTGDGILILNDNDILGADRLWFPRKPVSLDTGDSTLSATNPNLVPVVAANEHLRLRIIPGSAGIRGRFYIWVKSEK